jgi:hypothetical protein
VFWRNICLRLIIALRIDTSMRGKTEDNPIRQPRKHRIAKIIATYQRWQVARRSGSQLAVQDRRATPAFAPRSGPCPGCTAMFRRRPCVFDRSNLLLLKKNELMQAHIKRLKLSKLARIRTDVPRDRGAAISDKPFAAQLYDNDGIRRRRRT